MSYRSSSSFTRVLALACTLASVRAGLAQDAPPTTIRQSELRQDALTNLEIVVRPGEVIESGTILLKDGVITAVGADVEVRLIHRS